MARLLNPGHRALRAIVFDVGGVLRDSQALEAHCFAHAFGSCGVDVALSPTHWRAVHQIRGLYSFNSLLHACRLVLALSKSKQEHLLHDIDRPDIEDTLNALVQCHVSQAEEATAVRAHEEYRRLFALPEAGERVTLIDGAKAALERLRQRYALGVLSNSTVPAVTRDLEPVAHCFSFLVCEAKKPSSDAYLRCLREHGLAPSDVAYVGDAVSDIALAKSSGSVSVAVLSGMGTLNQLTSAKPDYLFKDISEMADTFLE
mmetsp:Transcript_30655/g.76918  ORF Transcript_30655/g.76918 Transcript_30655/m.76918 type:complete len:259 (-) Transcript_30655:69-845(-)